MEVLSISEINQNSSIIRMTVSMKHVIFVRINNQYFYNPKTKISLTFVIPINDKRELKIQGLGLFKRTKKYSYDLSSTINLSVEKFNPNATDLLVGKTFVVSGVFELFSRDDLKKSIEDNGGKVGSSISAKTDFVIAGDNMGPAKLEKANQLKIAIISEVDFQQMVTQ